MSHFYDQNGEQLPTRAEFEFRINELKETIAELQIELKILSRTIQEPRKLDTEPNNSLHSSP